MLQSLNYTIDEIRDEASHLVERGKIRRDHPIHILCRFFPDHDWCKIEHELELNQYLLRDRICDLVSRECWVND